MEQRAAEGQQRLLLAGSTGPERLPARLDPEDANWFEPLHVRDAVAARERIASQIGAGADVVVAPTWQTHRRALLPLGETRRARAWTLAAVEVARQGIEMGLEAREAARHEDASAIETSARVDLAEAATSPERPPPLVAGVLPRLDEEAGVATGQLAPADVANERDYRDQAGLLADAEVDLTLVEGLVTVSATQAALDAVAATGRPAWAAAPGRVAPTTGSTGPLERWQEICIESGASLLLGPARSADDAAADDGVVADILGGGPVPWGVQTTARREVDASIVADWFERGVTVVARPDDATASMLGPLRMAIDAYEAKRRSETERLASRWQGFIDRAARMASGGQAAAITAETGDPALALPDSHEWLRVPAEAAPQLPTGRFRLLVSDRSTADLDTLVEALDRGGLLVLRQSRGIRLPPGMAVLAVDEDAEPALMLLRRED